MTVTSQAVAIGGKTYIMSSDDVYLEDVGASFDDSVAELIAATLNRGDVAFDVGANIGMTAILMADRCREVHAFEASPSTAGILTSNINSNGISNVRVIAKGLGARPGALRLTREASNRSGGFINTAGITFAKHVDELAAILTLDQYIRETGVRPNFMKIDVEGFEDYVLDGGQECIATAKPRVLLELNPYCINAFRRMSVLDFLEKLRDLFPYAYAVDHDNITTPNLADNAGLYLVTHDSIVRNRFPNIIAGFDASLASDLKRLADGKMAAIRAAQRNMPERFLGSISIIDEDDVFHAESVREVVVELRNTGQKYVFAGGGGNDKPQLSHSNRSWRDSGVRRYSDEAGGGGVGAWSDPQAVDARRGAARAWCL